MFSPTVKLSKGRSPLSRPRFILRLVTSSKSNDKVYSPPPIVYVSDNRLSLESTTIRIRSIVGETTLKFPHFPRSLLNTKLIKRRESDNINLVVLFVFYRDLGGRGRGIIFGESFYRISEIEDGYPRLNL